MRRFTIESEPGHDNPAHPGLTSHQKRSAASDASLETAGYDPRYVKNCRRTKQSKQPKSPK